MAENIPFEFENNDFWSEDLKTLLKEGCDQAIQKRHEFVTPEHILYILSNHPEFFRSISTIGGNPSYLIENLENYINGLEQVPENFIYQLEISDQLQILINIASVQVIESGREMMEIPHFVRSIFALDNSNAKFFLENAINGEVGNFLAALIEEYNGESFEEEPLIDNNNEKVKGPDNWKSLVICVNDILQNKNPLIGREVEIEKTIRVLCRKEKNNPLHIGEPGVGKTALVYGLASKIEKGEVPERLKGTKIYQLDLGSLLAGTQFRGDFEKKIKMIMDGASNEKNVIIYIDEIHNLVGAGATGEGSMDASNMLKPYLEAGDIRFIGSTTYDEYKRHFAKSKGIVRRFSNIDVPEPSIEETTNIVKSLQPIYEEYHGVEYSDEAIDWAVKGSAKHINDRFLPDKALDLIDEAGAYREINRLETNPQTVDKDLVSHVLSKICKVELIADKEEDSDNLKNLRENISAKIFGQDEAVRKVTEAILMSKAGLTEENKPMSSLLFVGPTGVGKTEVAKVLAEELRIELLRFDMSEYTEKHTVAKLIGSPAGYVGYEDGGLLTDAIRKTPNCVLLLDEIEKAHPDIYNILLQVMDYAKLTDNKGNKADFRNVVLIMTSNAGAQYAAQASVGFGNKTTAGEAMLKQVKKTFKPEFLNRLSGTIVFNDMSREMAVQILDKKLGELQKSLDTKNVVLSLSHAAKEHLLEEGFTQQYGARELDRAISSLLKPLLMRAILFGNLKNGGEAKVDVNENELVLI